MIACLPKVRVHGLGILVIKNCLATLHFECLLWLYFRVNFDSRQWVECECELIVTVSACKCPVCFGIFQGRLVAGLTNSLARHSVMELVRHDGQKASQP